MKWWIITLIVLGTVIILFLLFEIGLSVFAYQIGFKRAKAITPEQIKKKNDFFPYKEEMIQNYHKYLYSIPKEKIEILNQRNKHLVGWLTKSNDNPTHQVIIFSHGFHSTGAIDISFTNLWMFHQHFDVLVIDQEGHGESEGKQIGFGILDSYNIEEWVKKINKIYAHHCQIMLYGISMGANTILLDANRPMENVMGLIADCGFTSCYDELKTIVKLDIHMFFIRRYILFKCHYDIKKNSSLNTLKESLYPVLFIHGKNDKFVPTFMSEKNYQITSSTKDILLVNKATHALSCLVGKNQYIEKCLSFIDICTHQFTRI